jgi:hypothetical protein
MSSHNLPTVDQIAAYHAGKLPLKERRILEARMKKNPFVREVVMLSPGVDLAAVKRISGKVSNATHYDYFSKGGFWTRTGSWIGIAGLAAIIGTGVYFQDEILNFVQGEEEVMMVEESSALNNQEITDIEANEIPLEVKKNRTNAASSDPTPVNEDIAVVADTDDDVVHEDIVIATPEPIKKEEPTIQKTENSKEKLAMTVLAAKSLTIVSKKNPDSNGSSVEADFPAYPSGDQGLKNYLRKSVKSIEVADAGKYERKAIISFAVSNKGKVSDASVNGNIHPTHKAQILDAINAIPKFNSGKVKVVYTLEFRY